jgi:hypothetical protein
MSPTVEPVAPLLDERFFQQVDDSLAALLDRVNAEEEHFAAEDAPEPQSPQIWDEIMGRLNQRLDNWQARLEAVAGEVSGVESELRQHQEALRGWTAALESMRGTTLEGKPSPG